VKLEFDENDVLHICPETSTEVRALKYFKKEYEEHGEKMIEIRTDLKE